MSQNFPRKLSFSEIMVATDFYADQKVEKSADKNRYEIFDISLSVAVR